MDLDWTGSFPFNPIHTLSLTLGMCLVGDPQCRRMGVDAVRDDAVVQLLQRQPLRRQHADDARVAMVELTTHRMLYWT